MKYLFVICSFLLTSLVHAQNDSTQTSGEILTGEIIIEKDKQILLPQAEKIYLRSQQRTLDKTPLNLTFNISEPDFSWPDYKSDVPFQSGNERYPNAPFQNYVKLGYGNFNSPLFEAGIFKNVSGWNNRARIFYESFKTGPVNGENSGNSDGMIDLSSTYKNGDFTLDPSIAFTHSGFNFYGNTNRSNTGYDPGEPEEGILNHFKTKVKIGWIKDDTEVFLTPIFTNTSQKTGELSVDNTESVLGIDAGLDFKIDKSFRTGITIEGRSSQYDGGLTYNRSLFNIKPNLVYSKDMLKLDLGFIVSSSNVNNQSNTSIYPSLRTEYTLSESWSLFGEIEGGIEWNSLNNVLSQNNFLDDSLLLINTEKEFSIGGGFEGNPIDNMFLSVSLSNATLNGLPFFVSSPDSSKYTLAYDNESVNLFSVRSSLSFMPNATSNYGVSLDLNSYGVSSLDRPWHQPAYILKAFTSHNIKEKLIVSAFLTSMGGLRGPADVNFGYVKLSAFTDVGLGAKYLLTSRSSVFIDVNNLLNNEYERYLGYPIRGLAFKIGGQYRF